MKSKHKDDNHSSDKMYAFLWLPPGEPCPENCVVYAIATCKEERDRFIKERGCKNMTIVKCETPAELTALGEYLGYPQEVSYLYEYKVGLGRNGEELSMLMTEQEHDEVMRTIRQLHNNVIRSSTFSGDFFKKKYRDALTIIRDWPISALKVCMYLFSDTFSFDDKEDS